jgi:general secretion pathway protein G
MWANLKSPSTTESRRGFTIVELLIVIVVIGILAAITIVAYNGIQTRAENAKTVSSIEKYATALSAYAVTNGTYPNVGGYPCLGSDNGQCAQVTDGAATCFVTGGAGSGSQATFDSNIKSVISALPPASSQQISCGGKSYKGAFFYTTDGKSGVIFYFLRGNQSCSSVSSLSITSTAYQTDTTQCVGSLPVLN